MAMTAFAAIGMIDSDAANADGNGQKTIMGSNDKPYALELNKNADAKIKYNYGAFTSAAVVSFAYEYTMGTTNGKGSITAGTDANSATAADINGISTKIYGSDGEYTVNFTGTAVKSLTESTKIDLVLSVTDKVTVDGATVGLPTQTYTFTAYIIVVDDDSKTIELDGFTGSFAYEKTYGIAASVIDSKKKTELSGYKFYATGLPAGLSMTVEGKIGGMLSGTDTLTDGSFTVYAVSVSGHVVSKAFNYTIAEHTERDFTITNDGSPGDTKNYATIKVNDKLTLEITPSGNYDLTNLEASSSGGSVIDASISGNEGKVECTFNGTGTSVITVSADVDGVKIVKTFTVYVVGQIVSTDLDPEVTSA